MSVVECLNRGETNLCIRNGYPRADHVPDHMLVVSTDASKDVEQHGEPTLHLSTEEFYARLGLGGGDRICADGLRQFGDLIRILASEGNVRVDHDLERPEYSGAKLWLAVQELRQQLRELGREGLL